MFGFAFIFRKKPFFFSFNFSQWVFHRFILVTLYFYTNLFVIDSKDYEEISRALDGITYYKYDLALKEKSAILVIASVEDSDKALKVLRGFNANPFSIPEGIPQIPHLSTP